MSNQSRNSTLPIPPSVVTTKAMNRRFAAVHPGPCLSTFSLALSSKMARPEALAFATHDGSSGPAIVQSSMVSGGICRQLVTRASVFLRESVDEYRRRT